MPERLHRTANSKIAILETVKTAAEARTAIWFLHAKLGMVFKIIWRLFIKNWLE